MVDATCREMSRAYASKDLTQKLPSLRLVLNIFLRHYSYLPQKTFFGHFHLNMKMFWV